MVNWTKALVYLFGVLFVFAGFGSLSQGIAGFFGGLLMLAGGLLLLPPSRVFILGFLDGRTEANFTEISSILIVVIALGAAFGGATIAPTSTSSQTANEVVTVTQTPISTPTPTQSATATPIPPTATVTSTPTADTTTQSAPRTSWTVTVVDVIDGDTMDVRMPDGSIETIRLLGVDTPETSVNEVSPDEWEGIPDTIDGRDRLVNWGDQATGYAEDRLSGREIYIEVDSESDRRGYYGRLLVYVYQSKSSDTAFNERLLTNGYARYYDSQFTKSSSYESLESDAQSNDIGVWDYEEPSTSTPIDSGGSSGNVEVASIHEDADGNDNENLNGEYVTFENTGSSAVDMTGWTVSDEADHTYRFPSGFTLEAGQSVTLYTGSGSDSDTELYWGQDSAVWNNGGDTVYLEDDAGNTVDTYEYS